MPPQRKRQRSATTNLAHARSVKQRLQDGEPLSRGDLPGAVPSTEISSLSELLKDADYVVDNFCEEWVLQLDR